MKAALEFPEEEGFLAEPLLMAFARGGGGDRRRKRLGGTALCSKETVVF